MSGLNRILKSKCYVVVTTKPNGELVPQSGIYTSKENAITERDRLNSFWQSEEGKERGYDWCEAKVYEISSMEI